jgi:predicted XRE-type DNA-binding protein
LINALQGESERQIFEMYSLRAMQPAQIAQALGVSKSRVTQSLKGTKKKDGTPRLKGSIAKIREKIEAGAFEESLGSKQQICHTWLRLSSAGGLVLTFVPKNPYL